MTLLSELNKHKITTYRIAKLITGYSNHKQNQSKWKEVITGKQSITIATLEFLKRAVSEVAPEIEVKAEQVKSFYKIK